MRTEKVTLSTSCKVSFKPRTEPPGVNFLHKQESPPAWTQEAYRLPCSEYSFCCPTWVPPILTWPGGYPARGVPYLGNPLAEYSPSWPRGTLPGYPWQGTLPGRVPPTPGQGTPQQGTPRCLPHGILGNVAKHYGIWVPPRCLPHGILGNVAKHYGIWVPPQVSAPWHSG